jgi:2-keto-4-pentenoate hydratase/2-oxohepta-3-ene-1,7-dioic acid hydratase in catechol pathway
MKLVRWGDPGDEEPGLVDADGRIRDLSAKVADIGRATLGRESLAILKALDPAVLPLAPGGARLGPCVADVRHFIAVGLNYKDHAEEGGDPLPAEPILFNKAPSSIVGPNDDIVIPKGSTQTDWEVELAIVIGEPGLYLDESDALDIVAGYCICHDVSERHFQTERGPTWMKGKGCPTFGPLGPWLVTPDEIPDVQDLKMTLDVNGERMQSGTTAQMIFGVRFVVAYISQFMKLEPGDVITTGTPAGVGQGKKPPRYLKPGDRVHLAVERLGEQRQRVVAWQG